MMARPFQNLLLQAYLSYKGLFLWLNWTAYVSNVIVAPPILAVLIAFSSRFANAPEGPDRYIQGMVIYSITLVILGGVVQCFYYDRAFGTLSFVYISPGNRWLTYLSRGLFHLPNGMLVAVSGLLCAWALLDSDFSKVSWLTLTSSVLLITLSCTCFALFLGNLSILIRDWFLLVYVGRALLLTLTGLIIPTDSLPPVFKELGQILPATHGFGAFKDAFQGRSWTSVEDHFVWEFIIALGYFMAGLGLFRLVEMIAKRKGTI